MTTFLTARSISISTCAALLLCVGCTTPSSTAPAQFTDTVHFHRDDGTLSMIRVLDRNKTCRATMHYNQSGVIVLHEEFNAAGARQAAKHFHEDGQLSHKEAFDRNGTKRHSELFDKTGTLTRVETFDEKGTRRSAKWYDSSSTLTREEYFNSKGKAIGKP